MKNLAFLVFNLIVWCSIEDVRSDDLCFHSSDSYLEEDWSYCWPGFCCGTCENRYCCNEPESYLDQTAQCPNSDSENSCMAYTDDYGYDYPSQSCDSEYGDVYCCGSCTNRWCCRSSYYALDQTKCNNVTITTTTSSYWDQDSTTTKDTWFYHEYFYGYGYFSDPSMFWLKIILIILPFFLVFLTALVCVVVSKNRQTRQQKVRPLNLMPHERPVVTVYPVQITQEINTAHNNDLADVPSYDSVKKSKTIISGPFIFQQTEDLPRYEALQ